MKAEKSCGNCIQCCKYTDSKTGEEKWTCENMFRCEGMPYDVHPPHDTACENWSDNPDDKDGPQDALRYFVDHFWDGNEE